MTWTFPLTAALAGALLCGSALAAEPKPPISPTEPIALFNGRDLDGFYIWLRDRGRDADPKGVFTVEDGVIRISGEEYGCITTKDEYRDYHLVVEFKWGDETFAPRIDRARDSGVLIHSVGEDGAFGGVWMRSIECQVIEGGTGDFIVVGDDTDAFAITCPVAKEKCLNAHVYQPDGEPVTIHGGRINWFARDPDWEDSKGFRGKADVEKPLGEWNKLECIADKDTITVFLNGTKVNAGTAARPSAGKIQIQSEGAEIFFRKIELRPLKKAE